MPEYIGRRMDFTGSILGIFSILQPKRDSSLVL